MTLSTVAREIADIKRRAGYRGYETRREQLEIKKLWRSWDYMTETSEVSP